MNTATPKRPLVSRTNSSRNSQARRGPVKSRTPKTKPAIAHNGGNDQAVRPIEASAIYSELGPMNKSISYQDGQLVKEPNAWLTKGTLNTMIFNNLTEVKEFIKDAPENLVMTYGVTGREKAVIVASKDYEGTGENTITRTRQNFYFSDGPGIMMLDIDLDGWNEPESDEDKDVNRMTTANTNRTTRPIMDRSKRRDLQRNIIKIVKMVARSLVDATMLRSASSSSGIILPDGTSMGLVGQRIYIPVNNASLIPAAGEALWTLLAAEGYCWVIISKSGRFLRRTLIDRCVFQPERLDFVAPPNLGPGLSRKVPEPYILGDPNVRFDLTRLIDVVKQEDRDRAEENYRRIKQALEPKRKAIHEAWLNEEGKKYEQRTNMSWDQVRLNLMKIFEDRTLPLFFSLITSDGTEVTVSELWDDPKKYDKQRFHDPLEPDYRNDPRIAYLRMLDVKEPYIYSHAHGGCRYKLEAPRVRVEIAKGQGPQIRDQCMGVLIESQNLYCLGNKGPMVHVSNRGHLEVVDPMWLTDKLERWIDFVQVRGVGASRHLEPADAPYRLAGELLKTFRNYSGFQIIEAVIRHPTLLPDGSLLTTSGYDPQSKLFLAAPEGSSFYIPVNPSLEEAEAALRVLWNPFARFPWRGAVDRGVMLSGLLTACVHAALPTVPGFGFDAPAAGSGKTLAARTMGALATGEEPAVSAPVSPRDDEYRKRLTSQLLAGNSVILLDNLVGPLDHPALNAYMTGGRFEDRPLSATKMVDFPTRALFLVTGNHLRITGDAYRRILVARMNAKSDNRIYSFDPLKLILATWQEMVAAALTIIRAWITAGRPRLGPGRTESFEDWDDLVRQPACWVASWSKFSSGKPRFADPNKSLERNLAQDPENQQLLALLTAWEACFNAQPQPEVLQVKDLISFVSGHQEAPHASPVRQLHAALVDIAGEPNGAINPRRLGWWLEHHADRPLNGLRLMRRGPRQGAKCWVVVRTP